MIGSHPVPRDPRGPGLVVAPEHVGILAEAIAGLVAARIKTAAINGTIRPSSPVPKGDPCLTDVMAVINAHPELGARCAWRWPGTRP